MPFFVDLGIPGFLYALLTALGFVAVFIFNGFYAKKYDISAKKAVVFSVVCYAVIFAWAYVLAWIINGFEWGHHNAIRVYIWMPLVLLLFGRAFKIEWHKACDFIAPSTCLCYGISRLGCTVAGCCYGKPLSWGIYSCLAGRRCYPVQLIQSVASIAIFFILLHMAKKREYRVDGKLYPYMLIMYGTMRFLAEFMIDKTPLFGCFTELSLWGLACVVMGAIWLYVDSLQKLRKRNKPVHTHRK